uniref:Glycine N-acyltransferase-like protein n=1 Tax=Cricetulus griseus TaxID=10029 RepID=A0A8C2MHV2_CRIGR
MLYLQGSQMLQLLENSLRKHLPESLKAYGTVFHMNKGNPFKVKALVDKWPDFNTVVIRPQEEDMTDDLDHYTNTYLIYSKDPVNCQKFLGSSEVINWKQHLQIQSSQSSLDKVIEHLADINLGNVKHTQCFLYMVFDTAKKLLPSLVDSKNLVQSNQAFILSPLCQSISLLSRPVFTLTTFLGIPVSWCLMDHTGELRMGGTLPQYRRQGLIYHISHHQIHTLGNLDIPLYVHVDKSNLTMQRVAAMLAHVRMPCNWNQWNYVPL